MRRTRVGTSATVHLLAGDGFGTTTIATTTTQGVACGARFGPFGDPVTAVSAANPCATGSTPNEVFWRGARRDAASGNYQFGSRTYTPETGRFLTPDTYRSEQPDADLSVGTDPLTANRYAYVNGDPVNLIDPDGHEPCLARKRGGTDCSWGYTGYIEDAPQELLPRLTSSGYNVHRPKRDVYKPRATMRESLTACSMVAVVIGLFCSAGLGFMDWKEGHRLSAGLNFLGAIPSLGAARSLTPLRFASKADVVGDAAEIVNATKKAKRVSEAADAAKQIVGEAASSTPNTTGAVRDFAHGTSSANAQAILSGGLDEAAGRGLSAGGRHARPGSFHTFEVTSGNREGLQLAYEMGLRHGDDCVVLVCRLPASTVRYLTAAGHVRVESIPGAGLPQTVFGPGAFPRINQEGVWQLIKPGG